MSLCAVIVAAYQAEPWIDDCLDSIEAQEPLEGWTYETRIGVDCCPGTAHVLKLRGAPYWWSPQNVGPYLVRNTLMRPAADAYAVFDADDIMEPAYLRTLLEIMGDGIAGSARIGMDENGRSSANPIVYPHAHGVSVFSAAAWKRLGGYRPWRIRADADALRRAETLKIPLTKHPDPLFRRRNHPNSLTNATETRIRSPARKAAARETRRLLKKGQYYVQAEFAQLEWRTV